MIIIVGAGPAGLAAAYYLQKRKLPYLVLEREAIGYSWRNHYDDLHLNTLKDVSALPGLPMPDDYPPFPSAGQLVAYLEDYAAHFDLNIETGVEVQNAVYAEGWQLQTNRGVYQSDILVVATGVWTTPVVPPFAGMDDFQGEILLARDYRNPDPYVGKRVLVVGLGNSAADIAVQLAEAGAEVGVSIRDGAYFIEKASTAEGVREWTARYRAMSPEEAERALLDELQTFEDIGIIKPEISPLELNAVVGFKFPEAVEAGKIEPYPCVQDFAADSVRFIDGTDAAFDVVILATGYRPTIQFVKPYLTCDRRGKPELNGYCSTVNSNLYCIGFDYPTTEGFLQSLTHVGRELVDSIAEDL